MKKAVKAKVVRMKIQACMYSRKLPESIKNAISLDVIASQKFQNFHEKTLIGRDPLLPSMAHFPKMGRFPTI